MGITQTLIRYLKNSSKFPSPAMSFDKVLSCVTSLKSKQRQVDKPCLVGWFGSSWHSHLRTTAGAFSSSSSLHGAVPHYGSKAADRKFLTQSQLFTRSCNSRIEFSATGSYDLVQASRREEGQESVLF